jgi:hypothetical protein
MRLCQMTVGEYNLVSGSKGYGKCNRPAKFKIPPQMGVEFVCGIHANSLNKMYERTHQHIRCVLLKEASNGLQ